MCRKFKHCLFHYVSIVFTKLIISHVFIILKSGCHSLVSGSPSPHTLIANTIWNLLVNDFFSEANKHKDNFSHHSLLSYVTFVSR